uniref:Retrotransposon Orf1 n=1 Tax=Tanacetum cinerariifolium TaxID=118510 RepID=A0A6L2KZL4_TANCI|nr:retrotransposon Orf1 [Tanacetum cinerariifolium]
MGEGSTNPTDSHHTPTIIQLSTSQPQKTKQHRKPRRKITEVPQPSDPTKYVADEAVIEEMDDSLERTAPIEPESVKKLSKKDQLMVDEELAFKLQVKEEEEERIQEELTDAEKAKLFMQFLEKRRKLSATKRDEEMRNRPPTIAKQRIIMCSYLKNMDGWKLKSLKKKSFAEIQELFDKAMKKVNTFVDFRTELVEESSMKAEAEITQEGSLKRAGNELEQERSKKQKMEDDKESEELKKCLEIIPDEEDDVTIDATPLSSNKMLKIFDREDLEVLWRLVKARFEKVFSTWMAFGGNTRDLVSFGEETDEITDLHQDAARRGLTTQMNFTSTDYHTKEELQSKGIKSPSKLLSPNYLSQSSIIEQNKNHSSLKRVHFVNSIVILNKENEAEEEGSVEPSKTNYTSRKNADETNEEVESEKEVEEETEGDAEEEEEDNPKYFNTFPTIKELRYLEWLLKNPWPPWLKVKIKTRNEICWNQEGNLQTIKKLQLHIEIKGLRVFVRNFTYKCDFMVLEDTTSVIDHYLGSVVFGKPFVEAIGLVYNKENGTIIGTDSIPPFVIESDDDNCEKTHYYDSLDLRPEYKYDEYVCRGILSLMATKARSKNKGEVTTWMTFRGNTRDLGSFGEETDEITDLHQDSPRSIVLKAWRRHRRHKVTPS